MTVGEPSGDLAGHVSGRCTPVHPENELYKERDKVEAIVDDVRVVEEGAADYGTRGRYDPPKLWFPCSSFVFLLLCQGRWDGGRRELGDAKRG